MSQEPYRTPSIVVPLAISLVAHFVFLGFVLTVPMFLGQAHVKTYAITISEEPSRTTEDVRERNLKKEARSKRMSLVKRVTKRKALMAKKTTTEATVEEAANPGSSSIVQPVETQPINRALEAELARRSAPTVEVPEPEATTEEAKVEKDMTVETERQPDVPFDTNGEPTPNIEGRVDTSDRALKEPVSPVGAKAEEAAPESPPKSKTVSEEPPAPQTVGPTQPAQEAEPEPVPEPSEPDEVFEEPGWQEQVAAPRHPEVPEPEAETLDEKPVTAATETHEPEPSEIVAAVEPHEAQTVPANDFCKACTLLSYMIVNRAEEMLLAQAYGVKNSPGETPVEPTSQKPREERRAEGYIEMPVLQSRGFEIHKDYHLEPVPQVIESSPLPLELASEESMPVAVTNAIVAEAEQPAVPEPIEVINASDITNDVEPTPSAEVTNGTEPLVIEVPESRREPTIVASVDDVIVSAAVHRDTDSGTDQLAKILTPGDNRTPTQKQYITGLAAVSSEIQKSEEAASTKPVESGMPIYTQRDIEIKIFFNGNPSDMSFNVLMKGHPMDQSGTEETNITEALDEIELGADSGLRRIFSLARASKGVYSFIVKSGDSSVEGMDIEFVLHKGLDVERHKKYEDVAMGPGGRKVFRFVMPEAIFWDDDDYFTGTVESSNFITKFNDTTGLIWKEKSGD